MADRETLLALKERVEKASGPDRELDAALLAEFNGLRCIYGEYYEMGDWYYSLEGDEKNPAFPSPTYSIDAALALCERMLPGWRLQLSEHIAPRPHWDATLVWWEKSVGAPGATAPLAILHAILSALLSALSQQPAQDGDAG